MVSEKQISEEDLLNLTLAGNVPPGFKVILRRPSDGELGIGEEAGFLGPTLMLLLISHLNHSLQV